jgi:hypothetical protein
MQLYTVSVSCGSSKLCDSWKVGHYHTAKLNHKSSFINVKYVLKDSELLLKGIPNGFPCRIA